ncbi:uncharacterized protein RCC_09242 [Ramularia collo-cygni]|uniref:Rhodopsin domain-containing protein n=1 Tax=Ramularia collo-cygni TaxID=112498 RepID=A0A2D3VNX4_9PEZI|nr:uncharacterized protein RCC_09242 [Ramularia collo-cygni]CZT23528.1 uncharacterized protein RCC_09242 [Ramularia collo-cygni]
MVSYLGNGITFPTAYTNDLKASGIAFPVIGLILLVLRALLSISKKIKFGCSEAFAVISWLMIVGMGVIFVWSAENGGLGTDTPTDGPQLTKTYISRFQWNVVLSEYFFLIFMSVALGTTKLSLLFFFRRVLATGHRNVWNHINMLLIVVVILFTVTFTFGYIFVCGGNPSAFWSPNNIRAPQCLSIKGGLATFEKASFITDFILDVICIILPFPIIWRLHLPLRSKITVIAVFGVGVATIAASIVRVVIWIEILDTAHNPVKDINLAVTLALQWGMIEAGLAFFVSQLPALGAYLNKSSREDIAKTIRYAASVISIRSNSSTESRNRRSVENHTGAYNYELSQMRREHGDDVQGEGVDEMKSSSSHIGKTSDV